MRAHLHVSSTDATIEELRTSTFRTRHKISKQRIQGQHPAMQQFPTAILCRLWAIKATLHFLNKLAKAYNKHTKLSGKRNTQNKRRRNVLHTTSQDPITNKQQTCLNQPSCTFFHRRS